MRFGGLGFRGFTANFRVYVGSKTCFGGLGRFSDAEDLLKDV